MKLKYSGNIINKTIIRIILFILLTFILSWGLDWFSINKGGLEAVKDLGGISPGMLAPAFIALVMQVFFLRDSKIYFRHYKEAPRWIFYSFFILFFSLITINHAIPKYPDFSMPLVGLGTFMIAFWTLSIFIIRSQSSGKAFKRAGLDLDNMGKGVPFIIGVILFFGISAGLNLLFGLGDLQPRSLTFYGIPTSKTLYIPQLIILFITVTLIGGPLSNLALYFGEEYGWRGFLQKELFRYNKIFGATIIGFIWGLWHIPLIIRGMHTYPPDITGILASLVFFTLWGIILSYSVLKTGSIWVAAFLHGSVNYIYSFSITYFVHPYNNLKSFGLGIYGILILIAIVFSIFFDPLWKSQNNTFPDNG